jgi:hypothetical protein
MTAMLPHPGITVTARRIVVTDHPETVRKAMDREPDYTQLDDPGLLAARAQARAELDEATARYQKLTDELDRRARTAWTQAS